jgi:diaminohydroxyphosphoribosylaminopyrimidine deaminase / 5-amino-6-(5-phosphoribosylamino)uracil reductase
MPPRRERARVAHEGPTPPDCRPTGRPTVTVKIAQTLDGRIATRTGHSQWISGEAARALAHELRASHDAVLVGIGTVLHDDPRLTVRLVPGRHPLRVVADTRARIPLDCSLLSDGPERTLVFVGEGAPGARAEAIRARGARVLTVPTRDDGRLDLGALLARLAEEGVGSLMVEGGAGIVTSLLAGRLVDRLVVCIAPKIIGSGLDAVGDLGIRSLADALTFERAEIRQLGPDIVFDGRVARGCAPAGERR